MKIVKVDAIESTNTFLKEMCQQNDVENYTVVVTDNQTNGRGQMHSIWESEKDKNLTFSILIQFDDLRIDQQFYIIKIISLAIRQVLSNYLPTKITVKWPNDILTDNKKVCGVLIENSVKKSKVYQSVVGIGLNVNQQTFRNLPNATSMKLITNKNFDLDEILKALIKAIKKQVTLLNDKNYDEIDANYLKSLYKYKTPSMFRIISGVFMGKIVGVSFDGRLQVELENEKTHEFNLKEIEFVK